jgi:heat shock protein HslJ
MAKILVSELLTLDGVMQAPGEPNEDRHLRGVLAHCREPWPAVRRPGAMIRRSLPCLAMAIAAALAACSSASAPSAPPKTLDGHTYLSTAIQGASLVPGTNVRLAFADGSLNAASGCNIMGGAYSVDGDRLKTSQLSMTEMACDVPRQRQDEWLARFLGNVTFTLDGDALRLTDGTVTLTLLDKEVATPDKPLEGTTWVLDGIISGGAVSSVPDGVTASIVVRDGRVDVKSGCNNGGGTARVGADSITFGPIALTKMACEPAATSVEGAVTTVLSGAVGYTIDADALFLKAGDRGLTFRAAT